MHLDRGRNHRGEHLVGGGEVSVDTGVVHRQGNPIDGVAVGRVSQFDVTARADDLYCKVTLDTPSGSVIFAEILTAWPLAGCSGACSTWRIWGGAFVA